MTQVVFAESSFAYSFVRGLAAPARAFGASGRAFRTGARAFGASARAFGASARAFGAMTLLVATLGVAGPAWADFTCSSNDDCFGRANQCDPGKKPCNDGICIPGDPRADNIGCVLIPNDDKCSDGDFCNGAETCDPNHGCNEHGTPPDCDDDIACTVDACTQDGCTHEPRNSRCDNGVFCDGREKCDAEEGCKPGRPRRCGDGVVCTVDVCDEANDRCVHTPNNSVCDNGLFCDGTSTCNPDTGCTPLTLPNCNDNIPCTTDACNEATDTCKHVTDDSQCNDSQFCNGVEICSPVQGCQAGPPPNCSDNVACTTDACNEANDTCTHTTNNSSCNNGLFCDGPETCTAQGCQPGTPPNCSDNVDCTQDTCVESIDSCQHTPKNNLCNDGDFCDGVEICDPLQGCQAGNSPNCADNLPCTVDLCVEATDSCSHTPDDEVCDDDQFCDGPEVCDPLVGCINGTPPNCADSIACTTDICIEATDTCSHTPNGALCSNGTFCDGAEVCNPDTGCQPGPPRDCSDNVDCTLDSCVEESKMCVNTPSTLACSDGVFCNGIETCDPVEDCQPGTPVNCNDNLACTDDSCNEDVNHCFNVPNFLLCGNNVVDEECNEQCDEGQVGGEICNNDKDDDADGLVDCADPDCFLVPLERCSDECRLVPPCTPLRNDPAVISFGTTAAGTAEATDDPSASPPGLFSFHARVFPHTPLDLLTESFLLTLSNANGEIYRAELPPYVLQSNGKRYRYSAADRAAVERDGGIARFSIRSKMYDGQLGYAFRVQAFGDFSLATVPEMTTQTYFGDDVGYVTATWTGQPGRWVLHQKDYDAGTP